MKWTVIFAHDPATGDWGVHAVDVPVFVGGDFRDGVERLVADGIAFHLSGLRDEGLPVPEPRSVAAGVDVAA